MFTSNGISLGKATSINTKNLLGRLAKNFSWLFVVGLLVLLVMEAFEVKRSISVLLNATQEPFVIKNEHGIRIDFKAYDTAVERINSGKTFEPKVNITNNPFGSR